MEFNFSIPQEGDKSQTNKAEASTNSFSIKNNNNNNNNNIYEKQNAEIKNENDFYYEKKINLELGKLETNVNHFL